MTVTTDQDRLRALAEFAKPFGNRAIKFGEWSAASGSGTFDDPISLPHYQLSDIGTSFYHMAYDSGWVDNALDWTAWAQSDEGRRFLHDVQYMGQANAQVLRNVLTAIVRGDRFCEGTLADAYDSGLLLAIAERAAVLASDGAS
jgi:Family of unknown function (DUF6508)